MHVPAFDALAEGCAARAPAAPVVVRDAARGYVLANVSMEHAGWQVLGNFSLVAGAGPRHAAVVIDTLGAAG